MAIASVDGERAGMALSTSAIADSVRRAASVLALLTTFLIVFAAILLLISALKLQRSVATDIDNTIVATVGQVRLDIALLDRLDQEAVSDGKDLAAAERQLAGYDAQLDAAKQSVAGKIQKLAAETPELPSAGVFLPSTGNVEQDPYALNDRIDLYKQKVRAGAAPDTDPKVLQHFIDALNIAVAPDVVTFYRVRDLWRDADAQKKALQERINELKDGPKASGVTRLSNESYKNVVEDFRTFQALVGTTLFGIVLIPNPVLVLLLAVFMGMLGSLIHLSCRVVLGGDYIKASEMFFRIGLGAAVSLALFFFASAGVLSLSQSNTGQDGSEMSPYLISFLGITAGFMSERVTAWMREIGENTFKLTDGAGRERWGTGLAAEMEKQSITKQAIAAALGNTVEEIEAWIALGKPVADRDQRLLAAYMRVHKSRLFTDIDPKEPMT